MKCYGTFFLNYKQVTVQLEDEGTKVKKTISHNSVAKLVKYMYFRFAAYGTVHMDTCPQGTQKGLSMSSRPFNVFDLRNLCYCLNLNK